MAELPQHRNSPAFARIALVGAAVIALAAIGIAVTRNHADKSAPAEQSASEPVADVPTMITQLEERLRANPGDAKGWAMLGWSYRETGRFADAATAYRRATALAPADATNWSALGEALVLAGKGDVPAEADAAFEKALAADPGDPRARYFTGVRMDMAGDHKGAIALWTDLLKKSPANAPWVADVRDAIANVAQKNGIKVDLPEPAAASASAGAEVAAQAIPGPTQDQMAAASSLTPGQQDAMVKSMVDGLAARLAADPKDADGWIKLMRARMVLGQRDEAKQALASARSAFARDGAQQQRLRDAARALGVPGA